MKKIFILILVTLMILTVCSCSKSEPTRTTDLATTQKSTSNKEADPTDTPAPTDAPTEEPELHLDKQYISNFLDNGHIIFMEETDDMNANGGSAFGEDLKRKQGKDGYEFTFVPNVDEHLPLIKHLDEFEGAHPLENQAVFIRFMTTTAGIYFSFLGDNDFGIYFDDKGTPLVFTYTENNPFAFEGDLKLIAGKWYNMLMAMDKEGMFNCIIYMDDGEFDSDNPTTVQVALGKTGSGAGYKSQSWQFEIATHEEGIVTVAHYDVYTYDMFVE